MSTYHCGSTHTSESDYDNVSLRLAWDYDNVSLRLITHIRIGLLQRITAAHHTHQSRTMTMYHCGSSHKSAVAHHMAITGSHYNISLPMDHQNQRYHSPASSLLPSNFPFNSFRPFPIHPFHRGWQGALGADSWCRRCLDWAAWGEVGRQAWSICLIYLPFSVCQSKATPNKWHKPCL